LTVPKIIPAASQVQPFTQGSLSRLCGIYSIMNAVQLGLYPLRLAPPQRRRLFIAAVAQLARQGLLGSVLGVGMEEDVWLGLAKAVGEHVENCFGVRLRLQRALTREARPTRKGALNSIGEAIQRRRPVLVYLGGALDHYTVIFGLTAERIILFDSDGLKWIAVDGVGLGHASKRRHWITPETTFALIRRS
jgi:hypothetical protein